MSRSGRLYMALVFSFLPLISSGQTLLLSGSAKDLAVLADFPYSRHPPDSTSAQGILTALLAALQSHGYFTAYTTPLKITGDTLRAEIKVGSQYHWAYLHAGNLDAYMQEKLGFREKFFLEKPFRYQEIADLYEKILAYAENIGYPFASVRLKDVQVAAHQVRATLDYQPGPLITFGELQIKGTKHIKADFLEAYLGISTGQAYDERKIRRIPDMIRSMPYLTMTEPVTITFQNETADVILSLSDKSSNELDGILNFFPSEGKDSKLLLTGELHITLNNLARSGKQFDLHWQRLQIQSQRLAMGYRHPNVFHTAYHGGVHFTLFKEDTLFINRNLSLETAYPFGSGSRLQAGINWQSSRLTGAMNSAGAGEALANLDLLSLGTGYRWQRLDDPLFPHKGYVFSLESRTGKKKVLPEITLGGDTPDAPATSWQQSVIAQFTQYHRLGQSWVLYHKLSGGVLLNNYLLLNDLYRLGGLYTLRGFYDNFFFASRYGLSNLELRLIFEQNPEGYSYLFMFYDQAGLIKKTILENTKDHPAGLGVGINLRTPAGLFSLVYALGRSEGQVFNFQLSKIHFGYISRF